MSDYFAELERHLVAAAERGDRRRAPTLRPRALVVAAAALAIAAAAVIAVPFVRDARETAGPSPAPPAVDREVLPSAPSGGLAPGEGCMPPAGSEPQPRLLSLLGALRRPATAADRVLARRMPRELAVRGAYRGSARLAQTVEGRSYWLVPVEDAIGGRGCAGAGAAPDGVCLYVSEDRAGELLLCTTPMAIRTLHELTLRKVGDSEWELAGIMPDAVARMELDDPELGPIALEAIGNVVVARIGDDGSSPPIDDSRWRYLDSAGRRIGR
jgi:hypothetical protein